MAKDLPYFKFFCSEWNDGDITLEDFKIQGLFINICSYYWSNECYVSLDKLKKRFKHNVEDIEYLLKIGIIYNEGGYLDVHFLDEQQQDRKLKSKTNSVNGSKGGRPKKAIESENKPNALNSLSETKGNKRREEKKREEKKREEKKREEKKREDIKGTPTLSFEQKKKNFIKWFNEKKLEHTEKEGKFKVLSKTDQNNLKQLFEVYVFTDFDLAIKNLFNSKWAKENNMLTPTHFLRLDNFNKYLDLGEVKKKQIRKTVDREDFFTS